MKQIIVIRKDLQLSKGKMSAQAAHASLGAYRLALKRDEKKARLWDSEGSKKVVVYAESLEHMFELKERVKRIPHFIVVDAGKTHLEPGTATCMGIGPWDDGELDKHTGSLKLVN